MKILSITAQRPDSTGSGVYLTELIRGFERLGHSQAVLAGVGSEDEEKWTMEKVLFFPVQYESEALPYPILGMSDEMPYKSTRYCDMTEEMTAQFICAFQEKIQQALSQFHPDVILCHHLYFLTALVRKLCPEHKVIGICHGSDLRQIRKNPWQKDFILEQIPKLDCIFSLHREQRETICGIFGLQEENVQVIGTGYNNNIFYIQEALHTEKKEQTKLIFAGKISEKKGVLSLLKATKYLKNPENYSLCLAGGYGNRQEYDLICQTAKTSPCRVDFLGKLSQKELAKVMNEGDVFVLPSFYEGLPLVLIEAMACGLSVVCTDLPGIKPWLDERIPENGVVFVSPPTMANQDEPVEAELPRFEKDLAQSIESAKTARKADQNLLTTVSWDGLCNKIQDILVDIR